MSQPERNTPGSPPPKPRVKRGRAGRWRNGPVPVIGLIGGMGSGKTLVGSLFAERGAIVIEADAVGHSLMNQRPARDKIVQKFGSKVLDLTKSDEALPPIDRKALGQIVFSDANARRDLEAILHPAMRKTFERVIDRAARQDRTTAVVIDAAILFEAGWNQLCDMVVFVDCPRDVRVARLAATRGWTPEMLDAREKAQISLEDKKSRSDHVIVNDSDLSRLQAAVEAFWSKSMKSAKAKAAKLAASRPARPTKRAEQPANPSEHDKPTDASTEPDDATEGD